MALIWLIPVLVERVSIHFQTKPIPPSQWDFLKFAQLHEIPLMDDWLSRSLKHFL